MPDLARTPLYDLHVELGGKMVPFAGWEMPVQYPMGVMKEHIACRTGAGLFDVSHMGQVSITHPDGPDAAATALERLVPQSVVALKDGRQRYGLFTDQTGGILDDLMIARRADDLFLVVRRGSWSRAIHVASPPAWRARQVHRHGCAGSRGCHSRRSKDRSWAGVCVARTGLASPARRVITGPRRGRIRPLPVPKEQAPR